MADVSAQLDYAQSPGWRQRKSLRRAVFAAGFLLLMLGSLKFVRPTWDHAWLLLYQGRCLNHIDASGTIAFSNSASTAQSEGDWERFYRLFSPPGGRHGAIVFVHELRRTDGTARLVAIEADIQRGITSGALEPVPVRFDSTVIEPSGALCRPQLLSHGSWLSPLDITVRLHAGQPDSADPSHFTIAFDNGERGGTIDGWLQGDDTILLELRDHLATNK